jgi:hypothetical protein
VKKSLRTVAAVLVLAAAGLWLVTGANRGWTETAVPRKTLDDVTGIEGIAYERKFVPGVDFLAGAIAGAGGLAAASFFFRDKSTIN